MLPTLNVSLKKGSECSFKEVYESYHKALYAYVIQKTGSTYLAEETVQITFVKLWKYRKSIDESLTISSQLFRIARTTLIDLLRKEQSSMKYFHHCLLKESEATHCAMNQQLELKETQQKLEKLINLLPPTRKKVFELSRIEHLSYKEIAELLCITPKTVENHIHLALKYLRPFFSIFAAALIYVGLLFV